MNALVGGVEGRGAADLTRAMGAREFQLFRDLIQRKTGIYLRDGKHIMLAARLGKRLRCLGLSDFAAYYAYVERAGDGKEMRALINCVTTNKTSFFREVHHFTFLAETLVRERCAAAAQGGPRTIRGWSGACSSGEEAYSIAITLSEALRGAQGQPPGRSARLSSSPTAACGWRVEVVASDLDTEVLEVGRRGIYNEDRLESVPVQVPRAGYFLRGKGEMRGMVRVKSEVRSLLDFRHLNLVEEKWDLDGPFDFIFFRNALIYFDRPTQDAVLRKMLRYLKPHGLLFLGHSEYIFWLSDVLVPVENTIFRRREAEGPHV